MAMPVSSQSFEPTLENFFGLYIGNEYEYEDESIERGMEITKWVNPHLEQSNILAKPSLSAITPYIPGDSQQFVFNAPSEFWNQDVTVVILSNLDLKNLVNSSSVCKFFYLASKADLVWRVQLSQFLPNVTVVTPDLCIYSPEQQYKVIFKRIENECKPYIAKFNRNKELGDNWLNELKTLKLQFQEAGGRAAVYRYRDFVRQHVNKVDFETLKQNCPDYPAGLLKEKIAVLKDTLWMTFGANYNGTIESIDLNNYQGRIMNAINVLVPNAFNDQEKFESVIEKSVAALNTSSSNSDGPTIEDVTDVAEPSEKNG